MTRARSLIVTLSSDRLLGGRVLIQQPRQGYRVAIDPVLLAGSVPQACVFWHVFQGRSFWE